MLPIRTNLRKPILFENILDDLFLLDDMPFFKNGNSHIPPSDIIENDNEYVIELTAAGLNKEDFTINIEDNTITISGERKYNENVNYKARETYYGSFKKSFRIPSEIIRDKIDAEYVNGILSITIPKDKKKIKNRTIQIK